MKNVTTRLLLTCAAIGAAGGLLIVPLLVFFTAAAVAAVPFVYAALVGAWFLPGALAQHLLRRPGVALLTMLISGLVSVPFSPYGFYSVLSTLFVGVVLEVPYLATLFRRLIPWVLYVWLAVFGVAYGYWTFGLVEAPAPVALWPLLFGVTALSHLLFVFVGRVLADRVARTGVVRGLRREDPTRPS